MWRWVMMVSVSCAMVAAQHAAAPVSRAEPGGVRVVRPGETLWGVAKGMTPTGGDVRRTVERLRVANPDIRGGALVAGGSLNLRPPSALASLDGAP